MQYPHHLYEEERVAIAEQLIEKELAKLLPEKDHYLTVDHIRRWREDPRSFHLENGIRDFWDIFAAIIESIKLKPSFTAYVTAENYHWVKEDVSVAAIQLTSQLDILKNIPNLSWHKEVTVAEVMACLNTTELMKKVQQNSDEHSSPSQDAYPIIIRRTPRGGNKVVDGNRRSLRAALQGRQTIPAWVAHVNAGPGPKNFWVPVNDMMQLVKLYHAASTDAQRQAVRETLEIIFSHSEVARVTFSQRVSDLPGAKEMLHGWHKES